MDCCLYTGFAWIVRLAACVEHPFNLLERFGMRLVSEYLWNTFVVGHSLNTPQVYPLLLKSTTASPTRLPLPF